MKAYNGEPSVTIDDLLELGFKEFRKVEASKGSYTGDTSIMTYMQGNIGGATVVGLFPTVWSGQKPSGDIKELRIYDRHTEIWGDYIRSRRQLINWYTYMTGIKEDKNIVSHKLDILAASTGYHK